MCQTPSEGMSCDEHVMGTVWNGDSLECGQPEREGGREGGRVAALLC